MVGLGKNIKQNKSSGGMKNFRLLVTINDILMKSSSTSAVRKQRIYYYELIQSFTLSSNALMLFYRVRR
jgi:hypothetical protein